MTRARWLGLGVGVLLITAAFGLVLWQTGTQTASAGTALAQAAGTPTPGATTPSAPNAPKPNKASTIGEAFWNALAAKLGIKADDLKSKALEVRKDMIDQAVKDGKITQDQANKLKERLDANGLVAPIFLGHHDGKAPGATGPHGMHGGADHGGVLKLDELEALAKLFKLSPSALTAQLKSGKTLADIAKAQGVDETTVKQTIIDTAKAQIDRAVQDGALTAQQADQLKSRLTPDKLDLTKIPHHFDFGHK